MKDDDKKTCKVKDDDEKTHKKKDDDEKAHKRVLWRPSTIRIDFCSRPGENACMFLVYKALRIFHVAIWFYALPFLFLSLMYLVPKYIQEYEANK